MYARGVVIGLDRYGNAVTNVRALRDAVRTDVIAPAPFAGPLRRAYGDVAPGAPLALVGSSGRVELAVCQGACGLSAGTIVEVECHRV